MGVLTVGLEDLSEAWRRRQLAFYFAWTETLARYRRSALGPLWLVLGTAIGVLGLGFVWSALLKVDRGDFIPSLTIGLVTWQMLSGAVVESVGIFPRNATSIINIKLPTFLIPLQLIFRHVINFAHNFIVVVVVLAVFPQHLSPAALLAIPGFAIVVLSLLAVMQILGYLGARYRDLDPLVTAFMPIVFFVSPVIYRADQLGSLQTIMEFNPIARWIQLIRDPILGMVPTAADYGITIAMTAAFWGLAVWITAIRGHRLAYWV